MSPIKKPKRPSSAAADWVTGVASARSRPTTTSSLASSNDPYLSKGWASAYWMAHATVATEPPVAKEIATRQGKPQSTLAMKLRKANRKFECKRNPVTKIEDVSADGSKWLKHMTKIHGRNFNTQRNQRIQDAYDNLSTPAQTTQQIKRVHSLYASEDRNVQREYSHRTQFSNSRYEVHPGTLGRTSDSTRRTKFIGTLGVLVPDRSEDIPDTPHSTTDVVYKPPNYRAESYLFQDSMGATVSDARPKSAVAHAMKTPKKAIPNLTQHPSYGGAKLKGVHSSEYVSTYMGMRPNADRFMKTKGNECFPFRSVSDW